MITVLIVTLVLAFLLGIGIACGMGDYKEFEKAQLRKKLPPKKTRIQKDLEARGRRVQVIDLDTGEVYEPKEKA